MQMPTSVTADVRPDPTVDALIPRSPWWRPAVVVLLVALLLVAAWFSPVVLRPALTSAGGWSTSHADTDQVLTAHWVEARGVPWITVEEVRPVPGTEVLDVWLLHEEPGADTGPPLDALPDARNTLETLVPRSTLDGAALPARVDHGAEAWLVIAWRVTDCQALADAVEAGGTFADEPYVQISTPLAGRRSGATPVTMLLDPMMLGDAGMCSEWAR